MSVDTRVELGGGIYQEKYTYHGTDYYLVGCGRPAYPFDPTNFIQVQPTPEWAWELIPHIRLSRDLQVWSVIVRQEAMLYQSKKEALAAAHRLLTVLDAALRVGS